jgi:hypothetical protein
MSEHSQDGPDEVDDEPVTAPDATATERTESAAETSTEPPAAASEGAGSDDQSDPPIPDEVGVARQRLAEIAELPVEEHTEVYEDVHRRLQDALADVESDGDAGDDGAPGR